MKKILLGAVLYVITAPFCLAQVKWQNVDSLYGSIPSSVHVFTTTDLIDGKPNIAYYVIADLKDRKLNFKTDTTYQRRFTPQQFYDKNQQPLLVVNGTFFDFATNRNLNAVIKDGKLVSYNVHTTALKGKDTLMYMHTFRSAIGINKKRKADVAWLYTDSSKKHAFASQEVYGPVKDSFPIVQHKIKSIKYTYRLHSELYKRRFQKWKMQTAIAGGPVLVQESTVKVTNNEERMFTGKAIDDKHPRTAMGYTADGKLIILVVQGRIPGIAEGASLTHLAKLLLDLGCVEALNLDGGGSSCMLVNGKETIKPSDKEGQRAVPGVFMITTD
ncbi:phosphodiester glycosidase family protein [Lacibacter sediminis]|uniref:Phosphodiester glycosidase family protein n=1 Tax=Lacibacter sediminis TaxID=2760713 RepID=A0A7G5XC22_9BACT|nr:phosphodiester glycosidase family protein [Lacibacter sediminis]QNA43025.1 phosphodiester glycosidase family protein [Lacibacter sediminis]